MDGEQDDDHEVFGEHDFTFDADSGQYLSAPRPHRGDAGRSGWSIVGKVVAVVLIAFGLTVIGMFALLLIALNSWGSNK